MLGYLSPLERGGYQIRQAAKRNLAWKVSDGQLYPQLANADFRSGESAPCR